MTRLLVLRPGQPGADLANQLTTETYTGRHTPSLAVQPIPFSLSEKDYDFVIFISPTAVNSAQTSLSELCAKAGNVIAVGTGTATELTRQGISKPLVPSEFNSEGLLAMPELQQVKDKHVLVVKGIGGRKLLADTLLERGAICDLLDVYDRVSQRISQTDWQWYEAGQRRGVTTASVETLEAFDQQRQSGGYSLPDFILVASDRIAETAEALGYTKVINVGGAANHHFANALTQQ